MKKTLVALAAFACLGLFGCANNSNKNSLEDSILEEPFSLEEPSEFQKVWYCTEQVCKVPYVPESTNSLGEQLDTWQSPQQTAKKGGDCEDLAFLLSKLLHEKKIENRVMPGLMDLRRYPNLTNFVFYPFGLNADHFWVEYDGKEGSYILEPSNCNRVPEIINRKDKSPYEYIPALYYPYISTKLKDYKRLNNMGWVVSAEYYEQILEKEAEMMFPGCTRPAE